MWYLICILAGYGLGIFIGYLVHRKMIDVSTAHAIKIYYDPETEEVKKFEIFYTPDSMRSEILNECDIFIDENFRR